MKVFKMIAIAFVLLAMVSCKNEQKEVETVMVDTVEKATNKTKELVANSATSTFKIEGMTCQVGCAAKIEKSLAKMDGVSAAKVNFETKTATVTYDADKVTTNLLATRVRANGEQYKVDFAKKCDTKCSAECKESNCSKCIAKKAACKAKCAAKKNTCDAGCKKACCVKIAL